MITSPFLTDWPSVTITLMMLPGNCDFTVTTLADELGVGAGIGSTFPGVFFATGAATVALDTLFTSLSTTTV